MRIQLLLAAAMVAAATFASHAQAPAPATPESLVIAAKRAAGTEYTGTFARICVAPDNLNTGAPVRISPSSMYATTEGVVRAPSEFSMTLGVPFSMTATQELVVPRSMPIIFAMSAS